MQALHCLVALPCRPNAALPEAVAAPKAVGAVAAAMAAEQLLRSLGGTPTYCV